MGLPLWSDPDEQCNIVSVPLKPRDTTAALPRSSLVRRPSIHGRRAARRQGRVSTLYDPPRLDRTDSHSAASGVNGARISRRREQRGVPLIPTLFEVIGRANDAARSPAEQTDSSVANAPPRMSASNARMVMERFAERYRNHEQSEPGAAAAGRNRMREQDFSRLSAEMDRIREQVSSRAPSADITSRSAILFDDGPGTIISPSSPSHSSSRTQRAMRENLLTRMRLQTEASLVDASLQINDGAMSPEGAETSYTQPNVSTNRPLHPLSNSWRPDSPVDGLGDRNRSPSPPDGWEVMRSTITPDENLPSAHSSFASSAASRSFVTSNDTDPTEVEESNDNFSFSADEENACIENNLPEMIAERVFQHETRSPAGRGRIRQHRLRRANEGNRFAFPHEPEYTDIGFRLMEEHLETSAGRTLLASITQHPRSLGLSEWSDVYRMHVAHAQERASPQLSPTQGGSYATNGNMTADPSTHREAMAAMLRADRGTGDSDESSRQDSTLLQRLTESEAARSSSTTSTISQMNSQFARELQDLRRLWPQLSANGNASDEFWDSIGLILSRTRSEISGSPVNAIDNGLASAPATASSATLAPEYTSPRL